MIAPPSRRFLGLDLKGGVELVYQGQPTAQTPKVTSDALSRAVDIMRERVDALGVTEPEIQTSGGNQITVSLPDVKDVGRAEKQVGKTARLEFYDWEANALTPNGKTVASQLQAQDPQSATISQGGSRARACRAAGACRSTTRSSWPPSSRPSRALTTPGWVTSTTSSERRGAPPATLRPRRMEPAGAGRALPALRAR